MWGSAVRKSKKILVGLVGLCIGLVCLDFAFPPNLKKLNDQSPLLLDRKGEVLSALLSQDEKWRFPIESDEIPEAFTDMLVTCEDKRFFSHPGIDPIALCRAVWQWMKNGRVISGGSTLTMQVDRLLDPKPRTLTSKLVEMIRALQLEYHYSKAEILRFYLILAPYGGNLEGIRSASQAYFQVDPDQLTRSQMALLVVLPQMPTLLRPNVNPNLARTQRDKILRRMAALNKLSPQQTEESISESIPQKRHAFPHHVPHLIRSFVRKSPHQLVFKTTLDKKIQAELEALLHKEIALFDARQTAAALIVNNKTRYIIAYCGSADFYDEDRDGQVDIIQAFRSPGSAMKPLIYAMAFDDQVIHPETLIHDTSTNFRGYIPKNFQDTFHGDVTIREALQQSLNIPAVLVLEKIGPGRFTNFLRQFGLQLRFPQEHESPSLSLALGGVGIRLCDLVSAYCALANQGNFAPLTMINSSDLPKTEPFVRATSSWYVTSILENAPPPEGFLSQTWTTKQPIAFKTGTSYGARDALCIGYTQGSQGHTVGVWTGRPDGSSTPNQLGRKTAAPLLFKIFNTLLPEGNSSTSSPPADVLQVTSHQLPKILRYFRSPHLTKLPDDEEREGSRPLKITFPQDGSGYALRPLQNQHKVYHSIDLSTQGGTPPLSLFVNRKPSTGKSLKPNTVTWTPSQPGFTELTVVDQAGRSDSITIQLH